MGLRSGPLGSHGSLPVLWLDGMCNQIRRLSHRVEADESSDLVCYSLDRVVERKARVPRSHVERKWYQKDAGLDIAPGSSECGSLNHCARFVCLSRAID